jgi:hypothetical protein
MMRLRFLALILSATCGACHGGRHAKGDRQAVFAASYGEPIEGRSLGFEGKGEARNLGLSAASQWFLMDRWAVGVLAGYRYYDQTGGAAHAFSVEATARHYLFEWGPVGFLFEMTGGGQYASRDVPPGGTPLNWTWGFGPTFEVPLSDTTDLLFGYQWRHVSNARGGGAVDNPTQNDHRLWVGVAVNW